MHCSWSGSSVHGNSPSKNTGVGCHFFFQGIFPTQGSNLHLLRLLHLQAGSLPVLLLLLSRFSRVWLCADPIDGSPPGSPIPGILQARTLEWVAISFSKAWKWKVKVKSLSRVQLFATPWTAAYQAPLPMEFARQVYWSGVPLPSPLAPPKSCDKTVVSPLILSKVYIECLL